MEELAHSLHVVAVISEGVKQSRHVGVDVTEVVRQSVGLKEKEQKIIVAFIKTTSIPYLTSIVSG